MKLSRLGNTALGKRIFMQSLYIAASALMFHDLFIIIAHTINPRYLEWANPFLLEKLLSAMVALIAV